MVLARYDCTIIRISAERNYWGDLLAWWVNVPAVAVGVVAVFASSAPDETMSSNDAIREVQQQARSGLSAMVSGACSFTPPVGRATKDNEDLFRVKLDGRDVLWIPGHAKKMQTRLPHSMRSNKERWTAGDRGNFAAATRVMLLVSKGGSRDQVRQAMSTHYMDLKALAAEVNLLDKSVNLFDKSALTSLIGFRSRLSST